MRGTYGWFLAAAGVLVACGGDDDWPGSANNATNATGGEAGSGGTTATTVASGGSAGGAGEASGGATSGPSGGSGGGSSGGTGGASGGSAGASGGSAGASGGAGASGAGGDGTGDPSPVPGTEGFNCDEAVGDVPTLHLKEVARNYRRALFLTYAPGDATRLFVVEQWGTIRVIQDGDKVEEPFLDLTANVETGGNEQGLLGLAFHPDYADNGRFYVNYTVKDGVHDAAGDSSIISEFTVSGDGNVAEPDSERVLMVVPQPAKNHNGGMLAFGPDGYLYIGLGDGGGGNDPDNNAQQTNTRLGKVLRIDVDATDAGEYGIPSGNLASSEAPEIYHYGLRNPWRFSFDGCRGDLYLGDVGQNDWEELNVVPNGMAHVNFGWKVCEGLHLRGSGMPCDHDEFMAPVAEYGRDVGESITGGYVYRGSLVPSLRGTYFYGDYSTGAVFSFRYVNGEMTDVRELTEEFGTFGGVLTSFGQDFNGEVYLVRRTGAIQRIEAAP